MNHCFHYTFYLIVKGDSWRSHTRRHTPGLCWCIAWTLVFAFSTTTSLSADEIKLCCEDCLRWKNSRWLGRGASGQMGFSRTHVSKVSLSCATRFYWGLFREFITDTDILIKVNNSLFIQNEILPCGYPVHTKALITRLQLQNLKQAWWTTWWYIHCVRCQRRTFRACVVCLPVVVKDVWI